MKNTTHPGLLRSFNSFKGRKSKTFPKAAIVGRRGFPCCAVVSETDDYVLVHLLEMCPEDVDPAGSQVFEEDPMEFRFNNWNILVDFLNHLGSLETAITQADEEMEVLCDFEFRSHAHLA
jgi:hypothetical protein